MDVRLAANSRFLAMRPLGMTNLFRKILYYFTKDPSIFADGLHGHGNSRVTNFAGVGPVLVTVWVRLGAHPPETLVQRTKKYDCGTMLCCTSISAM